MNLTVQFPDGPREVPAVALGRNKLGCTPPVLAVPKAVPGFTLVRGGSGWLAK